MRRAPSIVLPIVLLVVAAATIASAVQFAITFNGPPPFPRPVPVTEIAAALRDGPDGQRWRGVVVSGAAASGAAASAAFDGEPSAVRDAALAVALGVPATEVRGRYERARGPSDAVMGDFTIEWRGAQGLRTVRSAEPWITNWHRVTLASTLAVLTVLALLAVLMARRISRPIAELAQAAGQARLGRAMPLPSGGPHEVRVLADALDQMQQRILEQAEGRSAMLAAIAHDIGTPLSRLAFWIEQLPDSARERALADIEEMRAMLQSGLRFARDAGTSAQPVRLELGSLIESLADDMAAAGSPVSAEGGPRVVMQGDPAALRRMVANLAENAVRYGARARIGWALSGDGVELIVDDDGPGFDPAQAGQLFEPFARGDPSRNRATGGTGLGLAIVRAIVEAHGGSIGLETRVAGGGRVRVTLPSA